MGGRIEHDCHDITFGRSAVEPDHLKAVFVRVHPHFVGGVGREEHVGAHPTGVITGPFAVCGKVKLHFIPATLAISITVVELGSRQGAGH